jgi:hypothetical protein
LIFKDSGGDGLELHGFFQKSAIETGVEYAVDIEERVEVGETEIAVIIGEETCDHEEDFQREFGRGIVTEWK